MLSLSLNRHQPSNLPEMFKVYYAKGFGFDSHRHDFRFGSSGFTFQFMGPLFLSKLQVQELGFRFRFTWKTCYCVNKVTLCKYASRHIINRLLLSTHESIVEQHSKLEQFVNTLPARFRNKLFHGLKPTNFVLFIFVLFTKQRNNRLVVDALLTVSVTKC